MYHFGVPGNIIWFIHIVIGLTLAAVGYQLLRNRPLPDFIPMTFIVLGLAAATYHSYLWLMNSQNF